MIRFDDRLLECCDCGQQFLFTCGEQSYFERKALSPPKRCKPCRQDRRESRATTDGDVAVVETR